MSIDFEKIKEFVEMAQEVLYEAPTPDELEENDQYKLKEFYEEVANVINAYEDIV